jgi:hypothetical protein
MTASNGTKEKAGLTVAHILAGRHDGHLVHITQACFERLRATEARVQWRLTFDGDTWDADTVTIGELALVEKLLVEAGYDGTYLKIDPKASIWHRALLIIAHLHKVHGVELPQALARVEALSAKEQDDIITMYEVPAAPKDQPTSPPS